MAILTAMLLSSLVLFVIGFIALPGNAKIEHLETMSRYKIGRALFIAASILLIISLAGIAGLYDYLTRYE